MKRLVSCVGLWCWLMVMAPRVGAADVYYVVGSDALKLTEGAFPAASPGYDFVNRAQEEHPYAVLDGPGEIYVQGAGDDITRFNTGAPLNEISMIAIHVPNDKDVTGRLYMPKTDLKGMAILKFVLPAAATPKAKKEAFFDIEQISYQRLASLRYPGSAYFQYRAIAAAKHSGSSTQPANQNAQQVWRPNEDNDAVELFSGGEAVQEGLQVDRGVRDAASDNPTIDVTTLAGISTTPMDWSKKNQGLKPAVDALAAVIPADQPAVFFPSFSALIDMMDEANRTVTPLAAFMEPQSQDAGTQEKYERQLGVSVNGLSKMLGPDLIKSVALTASDPYLRTGTDVALVLEAKDPEALKSLLIAQLRLATTRAADCAPSKNPAFFASAITPDRAISTYMASLGNFIVVTNSLAQFQQIQNTFSGKSPAIGSTPEYTFFRDRYKVDAENESAFVVLTDATIRRWCGPRWRIADLRRRRAASEMRELQAEHMDDLISAAGNASPLATPAGSDLGDLQLTAAGVESRMYGSLRFMTPISELPLTKVSKAEADMYGQWRDGYEQNWRWFFDPIALRLKVRKNQLAVELTVMPLIIGSEYAQVVNLTGAARIGPDAADPHPDLLHFVMALDKNSPTFHPAENFLSGMMPQVGADPFGWLGQWAAMYYDDDPFWKEYAEAEKPNEFLESNFYRAPAALQVDVSNGFKLTVFVVALRAFIEQTSPQMVTWESMTYKDQAYVKVSPTANAIAQNKTLEKAAVYYVASGDSLIVTLSESTLKRALDRRMARRDAAKAAPPATTQPSAWLGESVAFKVDASMLDIYRHSTKEQNEIYVQNQSWRNLPILNEYRRMYPDKDPLEVHEKIWGVRLVDPAGGKYVWNEKWQTMESTIYGNPGEPKEGPYGMYLPDSFKSGNFGLTFEDNGLRAAAEINR